MVSYTRLLPLLADISVLNAPDRFAWTAVQQQVDWGRTRQEEVRDSYLRQYILNKATAIEMGFLPAKSLPSSVRAEMVRRSAV